MIEQKSKSRLITIIIHILIWGIFGLVYFFQPMYFNVNLPYQLWIKQAIIWGSLIVAFYLNSQVLVPRYLLKNKTGIFFLFVALIVAVIVMLNIYVDQWLNLHQLMEAAFHRGGPPKHHNRGRDFNWDAAMIATIALVIGISTSITAIQKWQKDKQMHQDLEQDRVTSELSFLKAQINPHFFFNTLNNIYALTHVDADVSRKAIHQLSRMMRYVLYDTQNSTTQLSQEIAFIKDYISLMELRLTDVVKVDFSSPVGLKDMAIAPMIFLPFIENAFKHGVSATQPSHIGITINQKDTVIELNVINTIIKEQSGNLEEGNGIGLNNTRRRLDLLYPGKHDLVINESTSENIYMVHLTLNLA
ncbi:histidine kinase [Mucilaginibacter sp. BJC16-A38]|uniref:sensor histidine kinase n=1 Tax=Mucilaginibacter phenanthrenivorans TaxID=1234842 RepID=UPI0021585DE5|nr:histidine kinase [Mucilaginibacter phenanthrenivorans]MCR8561111.1 histidine kinase [Mucilaginibacter phenanthrenivorans]